MGSFFEKPDSGLVADCDPERNSLDYVSYTTPLIHRFSGEFVPYYAKLVYERFLGIIISMLLRFNIRYYSEVLI